MRLVVVVVNGAKVGRRTRHYRHRHKTDANRPAGDRAYPRIELVSARYCAFSILNILYTPLDYDNDADDDPVLYILYN